MGELRRAVNEGQLELYFQPKIALADAQPVGMEALVRWRHPVRGMLAPEAFLPLAEQSHLMRDLTRYVMDTALDQASSWWRAGLQVQVAVNVSAGDLFDPALADLIAAGLRRHSIPPSALLLEITERVLMSEPAHAARCVDTLARMGIQLSLDDFGTAYSSLVRLKRLPVSEIKIDSSFIGRMPHSPDDEVIVQSLIDLVRALAIRSVAEGVETADVAAVLREMGCDAAQGWFVSGPMDAASATAWLSERIRVPRGNGVPQGGGARPVRPKARAQRRALARPARPGAEPPGDWPHEANARPCPAVPGQPTVSRARLLRQLPR